MDIDPNGLIFIQSEECDVCTHEINNKTIEKNNGKAFLHARDLVRNCHTSQTKLSSD